MFGTTRQQDDAGNLVWGEQLEISRRIGDDVAFGARILLDAGGRVAETIQTDAQNAERLQQVREHFSVLRTILRTNGSRQIIDSILSTNDSCSHNFPL